MTRYDWANLKLNRNQLGRYAEYFVKMEMSMLGVDIYSAEVDDHGIDFVARTKDARHFDVQVKSIYKAGQVYLSTQFFDPRENLLLAVVMFQDSEAPSLYLFRSTEWLDLRKCFKRHDYVGGKSDGYSEWGLHFSKKYREFLEDYSFAKVAAIIFSGNKSTS